MSNNIKAVWAWRNSQQGWGRIVKVPWEEGIDELLAFHRERTEHDESPLGEAERFLVDAAKIIIRVGGGKGAGFLQREVDDLANAQRAEGESK